MSPNPDSVLYAPFLTGRLGPLASDRAKERCTMSVVFLQGGGVSQAQTDRVPQESGGLRSLLRHCVDTISRWSGRRSDHEESQ